MALSEKELTKAFLEELRQSISSTGQFEDFAKFCSINSTKTGKRLNFSRKNMLPEQLAVLEARETVHQLIILKARQVGMTTNELIYDLWYALSHSGSRTIMIAQQNKTAQKLLDSIVKIYEKILNWAEQKSRLFNIESPLPKIKTSSQTKSEFSLSNGSIITAFHVEAVNEKKTAASIRGISAHRIHITEMASWTHQAAAWQVIKPLINPTTDITIESTPLQKDDLFHQFWVDAKKGKNGFHPIFAPWFEHPFYSLALTKEESIEPLNDEEAAMAFKHDLTKEQLKFWQTTVRTMKSLLAAQAEYPSDDVSCFAAYAVLNTGGKFVDAKDMKAIKKAIILPSSIEYLTPSVSAEIYHEPQRGYSYSLGVDPSSGTGKDHCAAVIVDDSTKEVCALINIQEVRLQEFAEAVWELSKLYENAPVAVEWCDYADSILMPLEMLGHQEYLYSGKYNRNQSLPGSWSPRRESRSFAYTQLKEYVTAVDFGTIPKKLWHQLNSLYYDKKGRVGALNKNSYPKMPDGRKYPDAPTDDAIDAYAIALCISLERQPMKKKIWGFTSSRNQIDAHQTRSNFPITGNASKKQALRAKRIDFWDGLGSIN